MTTKMAGIVYRNVKNGNIEMSKAQIGRMYDETDASAMYYANLYNSDLDRQRKRESELIDNLINNNFVEAQNLIDELYGWVK